MKTPHKHAEIIKAWADGADIQFRHGISKGGWLDCIKTPEWSLKHEYRIKPEKEYPKSSLTDDELRGEWAFGTNRVFEQRDLFLLRHIADVAVKRYIQDNEEK